MTLDVDVAVAVEDGVEATRVVDELRRRGYRWRSDFGGAMTSLEVPGGPDSGLRLDLLFSLAGIEAEVARSAERLQLLPALEVPVASRGDLIALKLLAAGEPGREHDWRDLRVLLAGASAADRERVRQRIELLARRGMASRQRLEQDYERLLDSL